MLDRDYCSDESGHSAEYKLGSTADCRERKRKTDVGQRQSKGEKKTNATASHDEQDSLFKPE